MSQFNTNENKALLWNLMLETNAFAGVPENKFEEVKSMFEHEMNTISYVTDKTLTDMNKQVLLEVTKQLHTIRTNAISIPVTNTELRDKRNTEFSEKLYIKQKDFSNMISSDKPSEIDFSDNTDNSLPGNIDEMLEHVMKQRDEDLNNVIVIQDDTSASEWIHNTEKVSVEDIRKPIKKEKNKVRFIDTDYKYTDKDNSVVDLLGFLGNKSATTHPIQLLRDIRKMHMDCVDKLDVCIKQLDT